LKAESPEEYVGSERNAVALLGGHTAVSLRRLTAFGMAWLAWLVFAAPPTSGHSGLEIGEYATAVVDGSFSESEYEGSCTDTLYQSSSTTNYDFTICEVNDETNDYWAIRISDLTIDDDDSALVWFDNNHDGVVQVGTNGDCPFGSAVEDYVGFLFGGFFDSWYCNAPPVLGAFGDTGSSDGTAARAHPTFSEWVFEFSHPLDSADPDDYSVQTGDTLGWCFMYNNDSDPTNSLVFGELQYPPGCFGDANSDDDAAGGKTVRYADVFKETKLHDELEAINDKLKGLVARCKFCPPDPRAKLLDKINEVIRTLEAEDEPGAIHALDAFVSKTQKLMKSGALPSKAKRFIREAKISLARLQAPPAPAGPSVAGPGAPNGATHPGNEFQVGGGGKTTGPPLPPPPPPPPTPTPTPRR
jgi:hypothetical protein